MIALMMEAARSTSEMSVNFYQTTRRNITEDKHLHLCLQCFENYVCSYHRKVHTVGRRSAAGQFLSHAEHFRKARFLVEVSSENASQYFPYTIVEAASRFILCPRIFM
jgi:hypothetical protein